MGKISEKLGTTYNNKQSWAIIVASIIVSFAGSISLGYIFENVFVRVLNWSDLIGDDFLELYLPSIIVVLSIVLGALLVILTGLMQNTKLRTLSYIISFGLGIIIEAVHLSIIMLELSSYAANLANV